MIFRASKQASWTNQFSQQNSEQKRNGVTGGIAMRGHILVDEASKIQKCGQFLRGFKTLLN